MSKIHLEIEIPGNAKTYEFVLDDRMKIGTAKEQIKKQIAELEGHEIPENLTEKMYGAITSFKEKYTMIQPNREQLLMSIKI